MGWYTMRLFISLAWAMLTASFSHHTKTFGYCSRINSCSIVVLIVYNCYSSFLSHSLGCDKFLVICCHIFWDVTSFFLLISIQYNINIVRRIMVTHAHTSFTYCKVCAHKRSLKGLRFSFSNYAFDVHTVYQWGLSDRYIIFKLRIWCTHSVSMRAEWPLSLFSNYAFDVHTVSVSLRTEWLLSLFSYYAFDVHTSSVSM